jgi:hypothetical protein
MKIFFCILLLCPLISIAQKELPRFENDTLYTSSGYKIYKGQVLRLAVGTVDKVKFRFIKFHNGLHLNDTKFHNIDILVKKVSDYKVTDLGNHYIRVISTMTYKDGSKDKLDIDINFDRAIEGFTGLPAELIVPEEFRNKKPSRISDEIERLFKLYTDGALTKEEFEALKKKIIEQN